MRGRLWDRTRKHGKPPAGASRMRRAPRIGRPARFGCSPSRRPFLLPPCARCTHRASAHYVPESIDKRAARADVTDVAWHLIGPLQGNKAGAAAATFDAVETIDRA